jgi:streptomycin 6-kinase
MGVPPVVRNKALAVGAEQWLDELPAVVASLEREWSIVVGRAYDHATEAFVAEATLEDGQAAVLKLLVPRGADAVRNEITVLRLTRGEGCVRLLRDDAAQGALLVERLGRSLHKLALPIGQRLEILCSIAERVWRPAPDCGLPTGAHKGRWLVDFITKMWEELDRPCSERAVDYALACAARRIAAHDDERAVLVHGDVHQWNALESEDGFKLVDPDGLLAEAEYDMGILMREDPVEMLQGDGQERACWLAARCGLDATAIWEWGVVERVSTGLLSTKVGIQPGARHMLAVADRVAGGGRKSRGMVDRQFSDGRVAALYDVFCAWERRDDLGFYLPLVMSADAVLDVGCGTGMLLHRAREAGHTGRLCGLDPAGAMLDRARTRSDIEWILGDLGSVDWDQEFDLVVMTGHAFQVLVEDDEIRASLAAIRSTLTEDGRFVFETRNPLGREWERWTPDNAVEAIDGSGAVVRMAHTVDTPVEADIVRFTTTFTSSSWDERRESGSTLRFLDADSLTSFLSDAGMAIEEQFGDWTRHPLTGTSPEIITMARRD